ncbi:MAG: hemerythrin domain-containing protein [Planctomycetes bacterium]|nr:hemerythrin domain-containing protein [Planctomycetota bacterium]
MSTQETLSGSNLFAAWCEPGERRQSPFEELLAEHHLMSIVLAAMEAEAQGMLRGGALRREFWSDVVDFNGNFVHLCHRVKEEEHLIPALVEHGLLDAEQDNAVRHEHQSAKKLTLDIVDGVGEGDWERVLRVVSIYVHILRPHMRREETGLFAAAVHGLPAEVDERLRAAFAAVDARALAGRGRAHFVEIARRLAQATGVVAAL